MKTELLRNNPLEWVKKLKTLERKQHQEFDVVEYIDKCIAQHGLGINSHTLDLMYCKFFETENSLLRGNKRRKLQELATALKTPFNFSAMQRNDTQIGMEGAAEQHGFESVEEMLASCAMDSTNPALCSHGCIVEPDGKCEHGNPAITVYVMSGL